jgi:NAD(P)-dependent dehydrogenase (short-subunit alcohol dehydrogenase family)
VDNLRPELLDRLQMDVTNKESIAAAAKIVEQNDSKLDILVNK